ncbi:MAG: FAD binding domain-containing protein [Thermoplasmata archaeon]
MTPFRIETPETPAEAHRLLARPGAMALGGGTDLLLDLESGRAEASTLVSLRKLPFRSVGWEGDTLRIGATAPLARVEAVPGLSDRIPGLATAVGAVGSPALRQRATLGGNLVRCAPTSDLLPILIALEATVEIGGPAGARSIPVEELGEGSRRTRLAPGELLQSIRVPAAPSAYLWQRVRPAHDISQVGVAVARTGAGRWAIAVGGVQPMAIRLRRAEESLQGRGPSEAQIEEAADRAAADAPFGTDRRATETYRRQLLRVLVGRAVRQVGP